MFLTFADWFFGILHRLFYTFNFVIYTFDNGTQIRFLTLFLAFAILIIFIKFFMFRH